MNITIHLYLLFFLQTKKLGAVSSLKESSRKHSVSATSSDSEEEPWPGSVQRYKQSSRLPQENGDIEHNSQDYVVSLTSKTRMTSASSQGDSCTTFSGERRTKSDSGVPTSLGKSDDEDFMSFPISVKIKTSSAPVKGQKEMKGQRGVKGHYNGDVSIDSVDDVDFESSLYGQTVSSLQRLSNNVFIPVMDVKQGVPVASVKEGPVDSFYPNGGSRSPKKQMSQAKFNSKTSELEKEAKKLDRLLSSLNQDSPRSGSKTSKQHAADVLEDAIAQQLQRSLAIYDDPDFELSGFNPSHSSAKEKANSPRVTKKVDSRLEPMTVYHPEFGQFTLGSNGQITHEEVRPRTTLPGKKVYSSAEPTNRGDHKGSSRTPHSIARYYNTKARSPRRQEMQGGLPTATDGGGDSGKFSMSSAPSWLTQAK